jgi:hypothetical protein
MSDVLMGKYRHSICGAVSCLPGGAAHAYAAHPEHFSRLWCQACRRYVPERECALVRQPMPAVKVASP